MAAFAKIAPAIPNVGFIRVTQFNEQICCSKASGSEANPDRATPTGAGLWRRAESDLGAAAAGHSLDVGGK
jgi:hypothetical protein